MGVLHVMNDTINAARDVMKTSAYRVQTFEGVDVGPLGFADVDRVVFYRKPLRKHTAGSEFRISELPETLPAVEVLYAYTEAPGYLVDALVERAGGRVVMVHAPATNLKVTRPEDLPLAELLLRATTSRGPVA